MEEREKKNLRREGMGFEKLAGEYLEQKGYRIIEYNFYARRGEIDLIARDGDYLVFCEVKYRSSEYSGLPEDAVDRRKQKRMADTAQFYLYSHGYDLDETRCRFDVISIEPEEIVHYEDAFWVENR